MKAAFPPHVHRFAHLCAHNLSYALAACRRLCYAAAMSAALDVCAASAAIRAAHRHPSRAPPSEPRRHPSRAPPPSPRTLPLCYALAAPLPVLRLVHAALLDARHPMPIAHVHTSYRRKVSKARYGSRSRRGQDMYTSVHRPRR